MNIYEIAKKCGVSVATISRAMNPQTRHKVAAQTLSKIDALVKRHQYTPNLAARNLGSGTFSTVGVLLPHFEGIFFSDYYTKVLAGVADALFASPYHFKLIMLRSGGQRWDDYNFKLAEGVDGLVVSHWPNFFSQTSVFKRLGLPCVVINDPEPRTAAYFVAGDNRQGGELMAKHLYERGHKRMLILAGECWSSDSRLRIEGFTEFLKSAGLKTKPAILPGDFQERRAEELVRDYLSKHREITAIACCNDLMACGTLAALRTLGLRCPDDVSVIGFDDDSRAALSDPPLTTIRIPLYEMSRDGTRRLLQTLDKKQTEPCVGQAIFPVQLVERKSVAKI